MRRALALLAAVLAVGGCAPSGGQIAGALASESSPAVSTPSPPPSPPAAAPRVLLFEITGRGRLAVSYVVDGKQTALDAPVLPWSTTVNIPADGATHTWQMVVDRTSGATEEQVSIDGRVVTRGGGSGQGRGTYSGTVRG